MVEDKIRLILKDLATLRGKFRDIKKDIRTEEKITDENYLDLKKAYKELREQIKEFEEEYKRDLQQDDHYIKLVELKEETEEKIAKKNEELFQNIEQLPPKSHQMDLETDQGFLKIQIEPEMRIYLNGKEEKRRAR